MSTSVQPSSPGRRYACTCPGRVGSGSVTLRIPSGELVHRATLALLRTIGCRWMPRSRSARIETEDERGWVVCRVLSFLDSALLRRRSPGPRSTTSIPCRSSSCAERSGEIVGLIDAECEELPGTVCEERPGARRMIWHLAVHPEHQRQGRRDRAPARSRAARTGATASRASRRGRDDDPATQRLVRSTTGSSSCDSYLHVYVELDEGLSDLFPITADGLRPGEGVRALPRRRSRGDAPAASRECTTTCSYELRFVDSASQPNICSILGDARRVPDRAVQDAPSTRFAACRSAGRSTRTWAAPIAARSVTSAPSSSAPTGRPTTATAARSASSRTSPTCFAGSSRGGRGCAEEVAIGTATDPYQPAEGRFRLTRACIVELAQAWTPFSIITRGPLVVRDIDVLQEASTRGLGQRDRVPPHPRRARLANDRAGHRSAAEPARGGAAPRRGRDRRLGRARPDPPRALRRSRAARGGGTRRQGGGRSHRLELRRSTSGPVSASTSSRRSRATGRRRSRATRSSIARGAYLPSAVAQPIREHVRAAARTAPLAAGLRPIERRARRPVARS